MKNIIRLLAVVLWAYLCALSVSAQNEDAVVVRTRLVNVRVSVTDARGNSVAALTRARFEVFDGNVRQRITHFSGAAAPVSLGIVYDVRGLASAQTEGVLATLRQFVRAANADRDFFIIAFNERNSMSATFIPAAEQLSTQLEGRAGSEPSALYDVLYRALGRVSAGHFQKKVLLVISNGQSLNSRHTAQEIRDRLREADIQVFAVGRSDPARDSLADLGALASARGEVRRDRTPAPEDVEAAFGRAVLDELTRVSGGYAYFPVLFNEPQFDMICARMADELRQQYVLGFYPTDTGGVGPWHKIEIRLAAPVRRGLTLSYRDGYRSHQ